MAMCYCLETGQREMGNPGEDAQKGPRGQRMNSDTHVCYTFVLCYYAGPLTAVKSLSMGGSDCYSSDHYSCRHHHLSFESLTDTELSGPLVFHRRHARYRGPGRTWQSPGGNASLPQNNLVACNRAEGRRLLCMSQ